MESHLHQLGNSSQKLFFVARGSNCVSFISLKHSNGIISVFLRCHVLNSCSKSGFVAFLISQIQSRCVKGLLSFCCTYITPLLNTFFPVQLTLFRLLELLLSKSGLLSLLSSRSLGSFFSSLFPSWLERHTDKIIWQSHFLII